MLVHAAAESSKGTVPGTFAVVLEAPNEDSLVHLAATLEASGVPHAAFREPDSPYFNQLMAIGLEPVQDRRMVRRFLKGLSLLGEER